MGIDRATGTDADTEKAEDPKPADRPPPDQPGLEPEGVPSRLESRKIAAATNDQSTQKPAEDDSDASQPADQEATAADDKSESPLGPESTDSDEQDESIAPPKTPESEYAPEIVEQDDPTEESVTTVDGASKAAEEGPESPPKPAPTDSDDQDQPTDAVKPSEIAAESPYAQEITEQGEQDQEPAATDDKAPTDAMPLEDTDSPAGADQTAGWQEHEERMRGAWAEHKSRWPSDESQGSEGPEGGPPATDEIPQAPVPPVDRPQDEPGSWRGEGGQYLNYEENYAMSSVYDRGLDAVPELADEVQQIEADVDHAQLTLLEHQVKDEERFKEKAAEQLAADLRENPRQAAESVPDAIRYTYQIAAENYTQGYRDIVAKLEERGHEMVWSRNFWGNDEYKGINTRWRTSSGQLFEVQFHSPESLQAKQLTHKAYERIRNPLTNGREVAELKEFQQKVSSGIPMPDGAIDIEDYRREGY